MNDNILITGASGGMGTATIALAKLAGATVIATTRHLRKAASLQRLGVDFVIDSGRSDAVEAIRATTGGEGVDALRLGGTFCPAAGELHEIPLRVIDIVSKELNIHGIRGATRNDQRVIAELLEKGRIRMPVHAALPLSKAAEAHVMLERGDGLVGRIVLHPWEDV
jgi:NADPH:quinone reductase-like Zn-dependent oxidoreductase